MARPCPREISGSLPSIADVALDGSADNDIVGTVSRDWRMAEGQFARSVSVRESRTLT